MINHSNLGIDAEERRKNVRAGIKAGKIRFGGNKNLFIYGKLSCSSGKRMKVENRVFFETESQAVEAGFRPCALCMLQKYKVWKSSAKKLSL